MNDGFSAQDLAAADAEKRLVALSSVVAAVFLTGMKIVVGFSTGSLGILSEAAHSALDLVAAAVTFWAVRMSGQPADHEHTYGHGKFENLSALFETLLLLVTCIWIINEAVERLFHPVAVEASVWGFLVMGISIVIDVSRSRALARVAKKYGSQALEADALHFSSDILSSAVVIVGLGFVFASEHLGIPLLAKADAAAALAVAGIVIVMSFKLGKRAIDDLLDTVPPELRESLFSAAHVPGVIDVKKLRVRRSGSESFVDVTLTVVRHVAFERAHHISRAVQESFRELLPGADVVVHLDPVASGSDGVVTTVRHLAARHSMGAHDIQVLEREDRVAVELHLEVDESLPLREAHDLVTAFEDELKTTVPEVEQVVTHIDPIGESSALQRPEPADEAPVREVLAALRRERGEEFEPRDVAVRRVGDELSVSFVLPMDPHLAVAEAHAAGERVEKEIRARLPGLDRVVIHVEPRDEAEGEVLAGTGSS